MDPRNRADEALARASSRDAFVVTPDNATSPMDASSTVRIPRRVIDRADDPDSTVIIPHSSAEQPSPQADDSNVGWPSDDQQQHSRAQHDQAPYDRPDYGRPQYGSPQQDSSQYMRPPAEYEDMPPNPYDAQRAPNEFGPLGSQSARRHPHRSR